MSRSSEQNALENDIYTTGIRCEKLIERLILPSPKEEYLGFIVLITQNTMTSNYIFYCTTSLVNSINDYIKRHLDQYWYFNIEIDLKESKKINYFIEYNYIKEGKYSSNGLIYNKSKLDENNIKVQFLKTQYRIKPPDFFYKENSDEIAKKIFPKLLKLSQLELRLYPTPFAIGLKKNNSIDVIDLVQKKFIIDKKNIEDLLAEHIKQINLLTNNIELLIEEISTSDYKRIDVIEIYNIQKDISNYLFDMLDKMYDIEKKYHLKQSEEIGSKVWEMIEDVLTGNFQKFLNDKIEPYPMSYNNLEEFKQKTKEFNFELNELVKLYFSSFKKSK
jgi:hypothetical protein